MLQAHATDKLRRPWAVWLALCIACLGALAPTLSHALHAARGQDSQMVEVCTINGPRWMALGSVVDLTAIADAPDLSAADRSEPAEPSVLEHCPYCLLSFDRLAPLPRARSFFFAEPGDVLPPAQRQTLVVVTHFAPVPPSRGPPTSF